MAKRKDLKNIACGILTSFISRNNDVLGYWGIGKLYSLMINSKSMKIKIDLLQNKMSPYNIEFDYMMNFYRKKLLDNTQKINLKNCYVFLDGFPNQKTPSLRIVAPNRIHCKIVLIDDLDKKHQCELNVYCRKHNPKNESKSTRKY